MLHSAQASALVRGTAPFNGEVWLAGKGVHVQQHSQGKEGRGSGRAGHTHGVVSGCSDPHQVLATAQFQRAP
jgi:hypothetical protein